MAANPTTRGSNLWFGLTLAETAEFGGNVESGSNIVHAPVQPVVGVSVPLLLYCHVYKTSSDPLSS